MINRKQLILFVSILFVSFNLNAQVFSGLDAFKNIIEFEGQRYLMYEVFNVKEDGFDKLSIDKTIQETDYKEGFMFVLTSYKMNDSVGAIFTSFNSTNFQQTEKDFVNMNLTNEEMIALNELILKLSKSFFGYDTHVLTKFNQYLMVDINKDSSGSYVILWINGNRHTFTESKWERAFKRYSNFAKN